MDDVMVDESDLDRMEYLGILSLELAVFSQRYQNPWKCKVAIAMKRQRRHFWRCLFGLIY